MPDHVHKSGGHGGDQVQVGQWVDGKKGPEGTGTVGTWTTTPGSTSVLLDKGKTHASKDFYDPIKKRQIMCGNFDINSVHFGPFRSISHILFQSNAPPLAPWNICMAQY